MRRNTQAHATRIFGVIALAVCSASCASSGFVPRPFPVPAGSPPPVPAATPAPPPTGTPPPTAATTPPAPAPVVGRGGHTTIDGYALAGTALSFRGAPYRGGGIDPSGFDCSGFTQYVFAQHGVALPREVREQYRLGKSVKPQELAAGDLVFFSTTEPGASHVAIAIGGDEFVHAPSSSGTVRVEHIGTSYWSPRFVGARRMN